MTGWIHNRSVLCIYILWHSAIRAKKCTSTNTHSRISYQTIVMSTKTETQANIRNGILVLRNKNHAMVSTLAWISTIRARQLTSDRCVWLFCMIQLGLIGIWLLLLSKSVYGILCNSGVGNAMSNSLMIHYCFLRCRGYEIMWLEHSLVRSLQMWSYHKANGHYNDCDNNTHVEVVLRAIIYATITSHFRPNDAQYTSHKDDQPMTNMYDQFWAGMRW